jgi:hypothetical protein
MPNPYSTSTQDNAACKRLFCGRLNDLTQLLNALAQGQSVALFGERRIGKTLLLFLLRDIVNGDIATYEHDLLDGTLKAGLMALRGKLTHCTPVFLSLHDLNGHDIGAFGNLVLTRLREHGFLQPSSLVTEQGQPVQPSFDPGDLPQLFATLASALQGRRVLLLFDEIEVLLDDKFEQATQVFRNLRSAIQTYPALTFVFAGAEDWHKRIKERTSPLVGNVKSFYLKAATPADIENYLLGIPLRPCFPNTPAALFTAMIQHVLDWTGSKPYYVQAVSSRVAALRHLADQWPVEVARQTQEDIAPQLANFYDPTDRVAKNILGLLAHQPGLTVPGLARRLGVSRQTVWNRIDDLVVLDKVQMEGGEYRIVGTLIAEWGQRHRDLPIPSGWPQRLRWAGTGIALVASLGTFWYTHPPAQMEQFAFAEGNIRLTFPASVEAGEQGAVAVAVHNMGKMALAEIKVNLVAAHIDFQKDSSSQVTLKDLGSGETRHLTLSYHVHATGTPRTIPVEVAVYSAEPAIASQYAAIWHLRRLPLQRWWTPLSSIFLLLAAMCKWDLLKHLLEPLRGLLGGKSSG